MTQHDSFKSYVDACTSALVERYGYTPATAAILASDYSTYEAFTAGVKSSDRVDDMLRADGWRIVEVSA